MIMWVLLAIVLGFVAYVRLAPHDVDRWHQPARVQGMGEMRSASGFVWRQSIEGDGRDMLLKLDAAAAATPRTTRLVGSAEEGKVTYVTRSRVMGFPDYNTIGIYDDPNGDGQYLEINSRLRFGRSDLGVNRQRVKGWLSVL